METAHTILLLAFWCGGEMIVALRRGGCKVDSPSVNSYVCECIRERKACERCERHFCVMSVLIPFHYFYSPLSNDTRITSKCAHSQNHPNTHFTGLYTLLRIHSPQLQREHHIRNQTAPNPSKMGCLNEKCPNSLGSSLSTFSRLIELPCFPESLLPATCTLPSSSPDCLVRRTV